MYTRDASVVAGPAAQCQCDFVKICWSPKFLYWAKIHCYHHSLHWGHWSMFHHIDGKLWKVRQFFYNVLLQGNQWKLN